MKNLIIRLLSLTILAACILFFGRLLLGNIGRLPPVLVDWRLAITLFAVLSLVLLVHVIHVFIVQLLLRGMNEESSLRTVAPIVLMSQFAKYVPGNVGHYVGRVALGKRYGYSTGPLLFTLGYEIGWVIVVALTIAVTSFFHTGNQILLDQLPTLPSFWLLGLALVALVGLPPLSTVVLKRWRPRFLFSSNGSVTLPPLSTITPCMVLLMLSFIANGVGLAVLGEGLNGAGLKDVALLIGLFAIAWLAGFVVPGAPGGLGVREALLLAGLIPLYGEPAALLLTISSRLCFIVGDGLAFLLGLVAYKVTPPPPLASGAL